VSEGIPTRDDSMPSGRQLYCQPAHVLLTGDGT